MPFLYKYYLESTFIGSNLLIISINVILNLPEHVF